MFGRAVSLADVVVYGIMLMVLTSAVRSVVGISLALVVGSARGLGGRKPRLPEVVKKWSPSRVACAVWNNLWCFLVPGGPPSGVS